MTPTKQRLETLECDIKAELESMAAADKALHAPITDGVVNIECYLASSPRVLWILKEPWEDLKEGEKGGGWSLTRDLIPALIEQRKKCTPKSTKSPPLPSPKSNQIFRLLFTLKEAVFSSRKGEQNQ